MKHRPSPSEQRRFVRAEIAASAMVHAQELSVGACAVENLSAGGALLSGERPAPVGARVMVTLRLPEGEPLELAADVVRREDGARFAVAFRDASPDDEDTIHDAVLSSLERMYNAARPAVLVVDDSPEICRAVERDLKRMDLRVLTATSACQARELVRYRADGLAAAVVDLRLADGDGLDLLAYVAERCPGVRRVLMSGDVRLSQLELARSAGRVTAVLAKPWTSQELASAVRPLA